MPAITATIATLATIGGALGVSGAVAAPVVGGALVAGAGYGAYKGVEGIAGSMSGSKDDAYGGIQMPGEDTGKLTDETAEDIARKKMFRSGTVFTSPLGVLGDADGSTTQSRLK